MSSALDLPEPVFSLPPLDSISDDEDDAPRQGRPLEEIGPLRVSSLVFGAAAWSHFYNDEAYLASDIPIRTTRLALRYGIRSFDTSPYYGSSEIVLGMALKGLEAEFPRESYKLMTKCGRYGSSDFDYSPQTIRRSVERSLARFHTTYLDTVYLHDVEFVATPVAPRAEGVHLGALGSEAEAYGLNEGQETKVWGEGDQKILDAVAELRKLQAEGVVRSIGITGLPLPTLLRLAILVLNTAPYRPLDAILSYSHLTLQNDSLISFLPAFIHRAKISQVLTASPLSMGLLTATPPAWHPAPPDMRAASAEAVKRCAEWEGGLPSVSIGWAIKSAEGGTESGEGKMPTVVGLSNLREVHQAAAIWRQVKDGGEEEARRQYAEAAVGAFKDNGTKDWTW